MTRKTQNFRDRKFGFILTTLTALGLTATATGAFAQTTVSGITALTGGFTQGDIVVSRVGDGSTLLANTGNPVFLDEYTTLGAYVGTITLPTANSGTTHAIDSSGTSPSEGFLNLSQDGQYLTYNGYNATPPTTGLTTSASATVNRVVARIDSQGNVDTSTLLTDEASGSSPRSAVTIDGTTIFAGGGAGGVRYTTDGSSTGTSTQVNGMGTQTSSTVVASPVNIRVTSIQNSNLYFSTGSTTIGIDEIGTGGVSTAASQTTNLIIDTGGSPYGFYFTPDGNTLYVADSTKGLEKYTGTNGVFTTSAVATPTYTIAPGTSLGLYGLTGVTVNGVSTLYGIAGSSSGTNTALVSLTDTGASSTFTTLVSAPAGTDPTAFRGIAFAPNTLAAAPEPSGFVAMFIGMGALGMLVVRCRTGMKVTA